MVDLHERLGSLVDPPLAEPEPMARLQRRARTVRRRRRATQSGLVAVLLLGVAGLTGLVVGLDGVGRLARPGVVLDQPGPDERLAPAPDGWQTHERDGIALHYPPGWSVVADPEGGAVIVGTRPLDDRNARLALLAHPDVRFTSDFPADGVFVAVGGDRFRAPGHELGEEVMVGVDSGAAQGIRARFGRVPASVHHVAAYAGHQAPAEDWALVEQAAETVVPRQSRVGDQPPPPPGPPGFPEGKERPVAAATRELVRLDLPDQGGEVVLRTGDGCAVVAFDHPTAGGGPQPQSGRCGLGGDPPSASRIDTDNLIAFELMRPPPTPGQAAPDSGLWMSAATRVGEQVQRVEARLIDGRSVDGEVADGWVLLAADGRIAWLTAYDAAGAELATAFVD